MLSQELSPPSLTKTASPDILLACTVPCVTRDVLVLVLLVKAAASCLVECTMQRGQAVVDHTFLSCVQTPTPSLSGKDVSRYLLTEVVIPSMRLSYECALAC
jgi:hypothetical protein